MNSLFQIEIPKRGLQCFKGQERLNPGMEYYSLLVTELEQKTTRQDYCSACWQAMKGEFVSKGYSYWQSCIESKKELLNVHASKIEKALYILKNMIREPNINEAELFVLALYLAHSRQLILRKELEENGFSYNLYEIAHQDEFVTVKKMELSLLETKNIQTSLAQRLNEYAT